MLRDLGGAERLVRAEELLGRAIEIAEQHYEADHPTLAMSYSNLATVLTQLGGAERLTRAEELLGRAIEIAEQHYEADHPTLAVPLLQPRDGARRPRRR